MFNIRGQDTPRCEEIERLTAELEAAIKDLETIMFRGGENTDTCAYCANNSCYERGGHQHCNPRWRGPQEE